MKKILISFFAFYSITSLASNDLDGYWKAEGHMSTMEIYIHRSTGVCEYVLKQHVRSVSFTQDDAYLHGDCVLILNSYDSMYSSNIKFTIDYQFQNIEGHSSEMVYNIDSLDSSDFYLDAETPYNYDFEKFEIFTKTTAEETSEILFSDVIPTNQLRRWE